MTTPSEDERRNAKLRAIARIGDLLAEGRWPSGEPISDREAKGLERTRVAIQDELRRMTRA